MSNVELTDRMVDVEQIPEAVENPPSTFFVYYDVGRKEYWIISARGEWITINETSLRRHLLANGYSRRINDGELLSSSDKRLNEIQLKCDVAYAGALGGYQKGVVEMCGQRVLVTTSPALIVPKPGEFPVLTRLLHNMFQEGQLPFVYGWLKIAFESLSAGQPRPGQVLVFAGERDSGKSLFQNLITEILGGRAAKPYRYMSGGTDFNGDLFGAEHLMIEDESASTNIAARRHFGARIKDFTVNAVQSCHAKNRAAISLKPFWRLSVSLNEEPENMMILPPLDESLGDKVLLLRVSKSPMPMPTFTPQERELFWETLLAELPAFIWHLISWEIPEQLKCQRFGIRYFHHPKLFEALNELTPENKLLALIDAAFNEGTLDEKGFEGSADRLQMLLLESLHDYSVRQILTWSHAMGTYLGRLAQKHPDRVTQSRTATERLWRITPKPKTKEGQQ